MHVLQVMGVHAARQLDQFRLRRTTEQICFNGPCPETFELCPMPKDKFHGEERANRAIPGCMSAALAAAAFLFIPDGVMADFEWVERPDPMQVHMLADADRKGDAVRVLYQSMPSLAQAASGDWTVNVYIAELHADGRIENRKLAGGQRHFTSLVLQRGGDGVLAVITPKRHASSATFEYWSAGDGSLRTSFDSPALVGPGGTPWPVFPTDDGNFFTVQHSAQTSRGDQPTTLTWHKFSPEGTELATGQWANPTAITTIGGAFPVPGGGMGLSLDMHLVKGGHALQTDIQAVQAFEIGGRNVEARVFSETRLLSADASGVFQWLSPALERELLWDGEMSIPQGLPVDQMLAQNAEQMALMRDVALKNASNRRILHRATVGYDDIRPTRNGYGALARLATDQSLDPPMHGVWFFEVGRDGALLRELRMEPVAEQLDGKLERFLPTSDGGLLVAGPRYVGDTNLHLTAINHNGRALWTLQVGDKGLQLEGLEGTYETPWAFGQGWSDTHAKSLLWVERVDPGAAQPLAAPNAQPRPRATSEPTAPPAFELPKPAEGCECSCEEFAAVLEVSEKMKSASQSEVIAMLSDPAFQARTNCMSGCAMQYAQCQ